MRSVDFPLIIEKRLDEFIVMVNGFETCRFLSLGVALFASARAKSFYIGQSAYVINSVTGEIYA